MHTAVTVVTNMQTINPCSNGGTHSKLLIGLVYIQTLNIT